MRKHAKKSKPIPAKTAPVIARPQLQAWLLAGLLVLATIALYWPALQGGFIKTDDPEYVSANPHVQGGLNWAGIQWAFSSTTQGTQWAPLIWLSHMLAWQFFGSNPWGHHLLNVLLHAANTALVFLVFRQLTQATWRSLILAALFGWHPLRVESVAWVTERKDVLSTLFWLLTLWAYAKYVEAAQIRDSKSKVWYGTALMMFGLGLMSKAMLVTLPFVLLLLDYWPLQRFQPGRVWKLVVEKIPFFALTAAVGVVTFVVQNQAGAVITVEELPLGARIGNALLSYCRYLEKMFWPTDLAIYYPHPGYWPLGQVLVAGVFLCGITVLLFLKRQRYPYMLMGWLWFVGTLVPVIGLVQVGGQSLADRYTYVPSLGVLVLTIWGVYELTRSWRHHQMVLSAVGLAVMIVCLALTRQQLGYWQDSETLFRHTLNVTENNYTVHKALGDVLFNKGKSEEAIGQYQEAIRLKPNDAEAYYNLGVVLLNQGHAIEAISQYQEAVRLKPDYADAHYNLGIALFNQGRTGEAISQFQKNIQLKPNDADAHINLGIVLLNQGRTDEAICQFQQAIRIKPDDANAQNDLAKALEMKNKSKVRTND